MLKKKTFFLKNLGSILKIHKGRLPKTKAQSLAEVAISLPLLLFVFSSMIEFGFLINTYLSLQDATRAAARYYANSVPFEIENEGLPTQKIIFENQFPIDVANFVIEVLEPEAEGYAVRRIEVDGTRDNILVSVVSVDVDEEATPPTIKTITRYPVGSEYYYRFNNPPIPPSAYNDDNIIKYMTANDSTPVDAGLLIIEIYYGYEGTIGLPWTQPFFSPDNPAMLYASTIMPLVSAKP